MRKVLTRILAAGAMGTLVYAALPVSTARAQALRAEGPIAYCQDVAQCDFDACVGVNKFDAAALNGYLAVPECIMERNPSVSIAKAQACKLRELTDFFKCLANVGKGGTTNPGS